MNFCRSKQFTRRTTILSLGLLLAGCTGSPETDPPPEENGQSSVDVLSSQLEPIATADDPNQEAIDRGLSEDGTLLIELHLSQEIPDLPDELQDPQEVQTDRIVAGIEATDLLTVADTPEIEYIRPEPPVETHNTHD